MFHEAQQEEVPGIKSSAERKYVIGLVAALTTSVGWIFLGLDLGFSFTASDLGSKILTLGGYRHTIITILALILIPICASEKRWGFIGAELLGVLTLVLCLPHIFYMLIARPSGYESKLFGPILWCFLQIPIIIYGYLSLKSDRTHLAFLSRKSPSSSKKT